MDTVFHVFTANLFTKLYTKFHQNRQSFIEDYSKHFGIFSQVAQLSQRDHAAGCVGQKWKTGTEKIFYGHYRNRSIFNHYDVIGKQSNHIRLKKAK